MLWLSIPLFSLALPATDWTFLDGALYYKSRLYVPEPARQELVHSLHCSPVGGHGSYFRTIHLVQRDYWWPGLTTFVR